MVQLTSVPESWAWMRGDLLVRLGPFAIVVLAVWVVWHPGWLGLTLGDLPAQLRFGVLGGLLLFVAAIGAQLPLTRARGRLRVPEGRGDAVLQGAYYVLNGPLEEAFFRGLLQGGLGALLSPPAGFLVATAAYVLYHRLGSWRWLDVLATLGAGVPLGLAFWLLPGPPSLLGVSIAHVCVTCGFLGPGPFLLRRLGLLEG